jgi:succinate-acetate transporter protein
MSGTRGMPADVGAAERSDRGNRFALISLAAAVLAVAVILVSFRGVVFITLPLAAVAFVLGALGAVHASRPAFRLAAVIGLIVGLLALLASLAALAADLSVSGGYDFYMRRQD